MNAMADFLLGMISRGVSMMARAARSPIGVPNDGLGDIKPQKEIIDIFARASVLS
jgi:hypothetical protein